MCKLFEKYRYSLFGIITILVSVLLFWKCQYGYVTLDEAFYPTIANRFLQGDKILFEEWSNTQLSALVLMPFLKCYKAVIGDYTGVYLYLRYMYTIIKIVISICVFLRMKRYGECKAFFSALVFLIYASYGLMVISYNTIAIGGILLWILLSMNTDETMKGDVENILGGMFLAIAVLGIPYAIGMYGLYLIVVVLVNCLNIKDDKIKSFYSYRTLLGITFGCSVVLIAFLIYVLNNVTFNEIFKTVPNILYGDPAHEMKGVYRLTAAYIVRVLIGNEHNYYVFGVYVLAFLNLCAYVFLKKKYKDNQIKCEQIGDIFSVSAVLIGIVLILVYLVTDAAANCLNDIIFVPNVVAILIVVYKNENKSIRELFWLIWVPGMALTYFEYIASNTGFSGISAFSCVASIGSLIMILVAFEDIAKLSKYKYWFVAFCAMYFTSALYYRSTYVFWEEGGINSLTCRLDYGVASGVAVSEKKAEEYDMLMKDTEEMRMLPQDTCVLYIGNKMLWLAGNQRCGSYSPLCYSISDTRDILYEYFNEHSDKMPEYVYVEENSAKEETVKELANYFGYIYKKESAGWIISSAK